jgi:hypothetical protein
VLGVALLKSLQSPAPPHVFKGPDGEWHPEDGYVWVASPHLPSDLRVRWVVGQPSNRHPHVETTETEGRWLPADGYIWVNSPPSPGDFRVKWMPGRASNKYPHVEADDGEGQWRPADGYVWVISPHGVDMGVKWAPGRLSQRYLHVTTGQLEGRWYPADGYDWVNNPPPAGDFRVKWVPERASSEYPNIASGQTEGEWHPAPGFTWLNPSDPTDYRVKPVESAKPVPLPPPTQNPVFSTAFRDGLADRSAWEQWFSTQMGDYRDGADYWAAHRSLTSPGSCYSEGSERRDFVNGCLAAKQRLDPTDRRRNSELDYKAGWNSYSEPEAGPSTSPASPSPAAPGGPDSPASPVRWYPGMDAPGNDLGGPDGWLRDVANPDDCMRKCLADRACVGATYNIRHSACFPKGRIAALVRADDLATTGVLTDRATPPSVPNVTARVRQYPNMDAPGNDRGGRISGVSSRDCESICVADSGCVGYTYKHQRLTCIPKKIIGGLAPSSEPAVTGIVEGRNISGH